MSLRRILIAVDDSPVAAQAVEVGLELMRSLGGEAAFIHVIDPAIAFAPESEIPPEEILASAQREGRNLLNAFHQRVASQPLVREFLPTGSPGSEIVKAAADWPADIIVVGSHGRSGWTRLLVGSVAEAVMRHAPCPVLVVPVAK